MYEMQSIIIQFSINVIDFININNNLVSIETYTPLHPHIIVNILSMIIIQHSQQYSINHHIHVPAPSPSHLHSHSHSQHQLQAQALLPPLQKYILNYFIEFDNVLGKGNFSTVYRCLNLSTSANLTSNPNQKVMACKLINMAVLRQQKIQHLVHAQIQILKSTNHQNVISCKDVYFTQDWCYIFSEYYSGGTLADFIVKNYNFNTGNVPKQTPDLLALIKDVFSGLLYLQKNKIIHRDIKPANIFLKNNNSKAVIADLGFSRMFNQPFFDLQMGSPPYMAPEALIKSYYNNKTDVWAFGVMLYQIFHGEGPYHKAIDMNNLIQKTLTPLTMNSFRFDLSIEMKQLILGCLQPDHEKRLKFSQIEQTWYFKGIFNKNQNSLFSISLATVTPTTPIKTAPLTERLPLNSLIKNNNQNNANSNLMLLSPKFVQSGVLSKSPSFSKINKIKSDIKKIRQQFVSVTTFNSCGEFTKTPDKLEQKQKKIGKMGIEICKQFYSINTPVCTSQNINNNKQISDQNPQQKFQTILSKISAFPQPSQNQHESQHEHKQEHKQEHQLQSSPNFNQITYRRPRASTINSYHTNNTSKYQSQYDKQKQNVYKQWVERKQFNNYKNDDKSERSKNHKNLGLTMMNHQKIIEKLKIKKDMKSKVNNQV